MKRLFVRLALVFAMALSLHAGAAAEVASPKAALHIEKYAEWTCDTQMPEVTREGIVTTYGGVGRINAFVVLYDYDEFIATAFGLTWPETWQNPMWHDCGGMRLGAIGSPGDHITIMFAECARGGEPFVAGWLSVTVTSPGTIDILPSEGEGAVAIVNCNHATPGLSEVMFTAQGGAGGSRGTDISRFLKMENRTWRVRADSTGDALSITHAIRQAIPGDTVAVAGGTYSETVYLRNGVALVGSYNRSFTGRDLASSPSIITPAGETACVIGGLSEDSTCVVDGFVLTGGRGNFGGGLVLKSSSSPTVRNLIIYGNHAKMGGGIFCNASSPLIENVLVFGNEAESGGGIACNMGASPRIISSTIAANAASVGGGVYARGAAPYIERSIVAHHARGTGIHCERVGSTVTFVCSDIWGNKPWDFGGAASAEMGLRDNISEDPLFSDIRAQDFSLSGGSPCRNLENCGRIGSRWTGPPKK